jgi:hypothetical protein
MSAPILFSMRSTRVSSRSIRSSDVVGMGVSGRQVWVAWRVSGGSLWLDCGIRRDGDGVSGGNAILGVNGCNGTIT